MTRGQIVLVLANKAYTTTEFNGDMYPKFMDEHNNIWEGHGHEVIDHLKHVQNFDQYQAFVKAFNQEWFNYDEQLVYDAELANLTDFTQNYFDNWFSDFLYIKNLSGHVLHFKAKQDSGIAELEPQLVNANLADQGIGVLYFGEVYYPHKQDINFSNDIQIVSSVVAH